MTQVKQANQALVNFMNKEMETDEEDFEAQLTELTGLYEAVVEKCKNYLDVHKKTPKFESGRVRKRLVKQQMDNAKQVLKIKNKTYFYKNDEALRSPMEEYDRRILGRGKSEKVNQIPLSALAARQKNSWKRI